MSEANESKFSDANIGLAQYIGIQFLFFRGLKPLTGFSIKKWFPKIWFLNQKMVSQNMVSQSKNGFPKYGFSIKKWFSKIWFLNHYMASIKWFLNHYMVSLKFLNHQMVPLYSFSIIIWFHYIVSQSLYGSIIWFLNHHMVSQNMVSQSSYGIPKYGFSIIIWFHYMVSWLPPKHWGSFFLRCWFHPLVA